MTVLINSLCFYPLQTTLKQPVDEAMPAVASVPTTHVSKATITPTQPSAASSTAPCETFLSNNAVKFHSFILVFVRKKKIHDAYFIAADTGPSSIIAHSRARRAARDRVPTGKLNASDVLAAAKQVEQGAAASTPDAPAPTTSALPSDPIPRVCSSTYISMLLKLN